MQTCLNRIEQNNDLRQKMRKIQFLNSFKRYTWTDLFAFHVKKHFYLHIKKSRRFHSKVTFSFSDMGILKSGMFVYKSTETIVYVKKWATFFKKNSLRVNNLRIIWIRDAKFLEYYFKRQQTYRGEFKICISVLLKEIKGKKR